MFSIESKFMQMLNRLCDVVILNVLYLLTCLPVFTIGAANAALYTVSFQMIRHRESGIFKSYFRAFRENFGQATVIWLLLAVIGVPALWALRLFYTMDGMLRYLFVVYLTILLMVLFTGSFVFPLISQFANTLKASLKNALILSLGNLPRTIFVAAINLFPWILLLAMPYLFIQVSFLWLVLYAAGAACINSALLWKVFKPFYPEET